MDIQKLNACHEMLVKDLGDGLLTGAIISAVDGQILVGTENASAAGATLMNEITARINDTMSSSVKLELGRYYYLDIVGNKGVLVIPLGDYAWMMMVDNKKVKMGLLLNVVLPKLINAFEDAVIS